MKIRWDNEWRDLRGIPEVFVEDPADPGSYVPSKIFVGEEDPAYGGEVPYVWMKPSEIGGLGQVGAKVYKSATQSAVGSGSVTLISFDTTAFDSDGYFDNANDCLTVPAGYGGLHVVTGLVFYAAAASGAACHARIHVNGTMVAQSAIPSINSGTFATLVPMSTMLDLADGDDVTLRALHQTGANRDLSGGADGTHLCIQRL